MTATVMKAKVDSIMAQRLSVQQILSAFVVVIPMLVGVITYIDGRYETKENIKSLHETAVRERARIDHRVDKLEEGQDAMRLVQAQTFAEVKDISGYLRAKSEAKK